MAHFYKYKIVGIAPSAGTDELFNVGIIVFRGDGVDVRPTRSKEKIRAISGQLSMEVVHRSLASISEMYSFFWSSGVSEERIIELLSKGSPFKLGGTGSFSAATADEYEMRVASIFQSVIDPEPAKKVVRRVRSVLAHQIKTAFKKNFVLASRGEGIDSHRVVENWEFEDGMSVDFALRNGSWHFVEAVGGASDYKGVRRTISNIAMSALIFECARQKYGTSLTSAKLVYEAVPSSERQLQSSLSAVESQGGTVFNWNSAEDRLRFLHLITSIAEPSKRYESVDLKFGSDTMWLFT